MPTDGEIRARAHPFPKKRVSRRDEGTSSGTKQKGSCSTTKLSPISRKRCRLGYDQHIPLSGSLSGTCAAFADLELSRSRIP
jgi:hypothetical protein